jgi:hypothetical protein
MAHERDYLERTIATVRNHRGAENCWPQWANIFADEIERLWDLLGPEYHVFQSRDGEWSLKHPIACREEMLDCDVHAAAMALDSPPVPEGRYRCEVVKGELTFERIRDANSQARPEA